MKKILLSMMIMLAAIVATAQVNRSKKQVNYEAASWKTWLLDNPEQLTVPAPSAQTQAELKLVRLAMAKLDAKKKWRQSLTGIPARPHTAGTRSGPV